MATRFIDDENIHNIGKVIAADGSTTHHDNYIAEKFLFKTREKLQHELTVVHGIYHKADEPYDGYKLYYYDENNKLIIKKIGYSFENVVDLINKAEDQACTN